MKENLIVLFGGVSSEHDISIISALQAMQNIDSNFYNVVPIYLAKNYKWYVGKPLLDLQFYINPNYKKLQEVCLISGSNYLHYKTLNGFKPKLKVDFAMPILHGVNGEDGKVASLLTLCKIPYSSADAISSGVCIDKSVFKTFLNGLNVSNVKGETVIDYQFRANPQKVIKELEEKLNYPLIVKPSTLGSSIGITVCKNSNELLNSLKLSFELASKTLVEQFLEDITEVNVAVMFNDEKLMVSELEQPIKNSNILSFENKYLNDTKTMEGVSRIIPAPVTPSQKEYIVNTAKQVYTSLNLRGVVRFDFILSDDKIYLNELNTIPGSLAFYLFKPLGVGYMQLLNLLIKNGYENFKIDSLKQYTFSSSVLKSGGVGIKK